MAIRVAHVGTGNVGGLALTELITNPAFELTGVCVSTPEKVGRDAGALCGVGLDADLQKGRVTGIEAVGDLDALLATKPDCVVYCAMGDTRLPDAMADVMETWLPASTSSDRRPGCCSTRGASCPKSTSPAWKTLPSRVIRASSSVVSTRDSPTT